MNKAWRVRKKVWISNVYLLKHEKHGLPPKAIFALKIELTFAPKCVSKDKHSVEFYP